MQGVSVAADGRRCAASLPATGAGELPCVHVLSAMCNARCHAAPGCTHARMVDPICRKWELLCLSNWSTGAAQGSSPPPALSRWLY